MTERELRRALGVLQGTVRRQRLRTVEIDAQADQHADAGGGKARVPAIGDRERAADERRQERADIDADIEDRVAARAPLIVRRIKRADLGRDIRLEGADAEDEARER